MVGTLEEALAQPKLAELLSTTDLMVIGDTVRLEIPVREREKLRKMPDLLRGLAASIEFLLQRTDLPERTVLVQLACEARALNRTIREIKGRGRPRE